MAQQALEVQALAGQNRNRVGGQADGALVPHRLFNLAPHRAGGYTPFGRRVQMQRGGGSVRLAHIANLIGYDETGIASFATSASGRGALRLFRGTTLYVQARRNYDRPSEAVHMENAGAYISRDAYLVLDRENRPIEPIVARTKAEATIGSPINASTPAEDNFAGVDYNADNDIFLAITVLGAVFRSTDRGRSWEALDDLGPEHFNNIAYGNGVWIAATSRGTVYRSDSDGDAGSWTAVTVYPDWPTADVTWGGGNTFFLGGHGVEEGEPGGAIARTVDGGLTWDVVDNGRSILQGQGEYIGNVSRVAYHEGSGLYAAASNPDRVRYSGNGGRSFAFARYWGGALDGWGWTSTGVGKNRFYAIAQETGRIRQSGDVTADLNAVEGSWSHAATLDGHPRRLKYNAAKDTLVVIGSISGFTEPRVWQGPEVGSLSRSTEIEEALSEAGCDWLADVAFDSDGGAVYVGSNGVIVTTSVAPGLDAGTYNLFYVTYFNTKAGRFVFDLRRETHSFNDAFGNSLTIRAQAKGDILAKNDWLDGRDDAQDILDSLRLDVYIQHTPEVGDTDEEDLPYTERLAEHTVRYAFTEPFPDEPDEDENDGLGKVGRTLNELPLGRQIVARGMPTTVVFEKSRTDASDPIASRTAVHNGRVWGLARQDEDDWHDEDEISPEIANQFNRFVLTYTETGWANLISDQSYIPIQPTQSAYFTGMLSTPSGLMVLFENEIFVVTGDPAFGNLSVDLYLDMVGCDVGTVPCKIGGVPFTIWNGKIWTVQAGQAQEISVGQWRADDPFVRIAPEPQTRSLLGVTRNGRVLRYLVDDQFWLTDPASLSSPREALPNCTCATGDNTRFVDDDGIVWSTRAGDGTPDTPHILYREVDFGDPARRTPLYLAKVPFQGPIVQREYDRASPGFDPLAVPALHYAAGHDTTGDLDALASLSGGVPPTRPRIGVSDTATLAFRPPLRRLRSFALDLRLELNGMGYEDVIRPPLRLYHAQGGTVR